MTVYSATVPLPSGYNDGGPDGGQTVPQEPTLLFPPKECAVTVRLRTTSANVLIGGSGPGGQNWPLPASQEYVLTLAVNEALVGLHNLSWSNTTPQMANVAVLVTGLPC